MEVTRETIVALQGTHLERLETDIVKVLVERFDMAPSEALRRYYESSLAHEVASGFHDIQYLSPGYLVDRLLSEGAEGSGTRPAQGQAGSSSEL